MGDIPERNGHSDIPEATSVPRSRLRLSVVWIIPIIAAILGGWIAVQRYLSQGPTVTITFSSAEGLEAGKTKVKYNGVEIGTISSIALSKDLERVIASAQMAPESRDMLVEDTEFWVVKPRISGGTVSGLGTLLSGSYIGMEIGKSKKKGSTFVALDMPPVVTGKVPGRFFLLKADNLGSLDYGSPLFFRRIQVGQVVAHELDKDGRTITIKVFVRAPDDQYVNGDTRFWNASGIDVSLSASGISVRTESLVSILVGGIAFETPPSGPSSPPAEPNAVFRLFKDREEAMKLPEGTPHYYVVVFDQSVRGLVVGAPVEFLGIHIGEVVSIGVNVNPQTLAVSIPVTIRVFPELLFRMAPEAERETARREHRAIVDNLVAHGFRAQLQTGNLLTGALYVAFNFFPDTAEEKVDWSQLPPRLPTVPGELQQIEKTLTSIAHKLNKIPLDAIGNNLRDSIVSLNRTLKTAEKLVKDIDTNWVAEGKATLVEARRTLESATRTLSVVDTTYLGADAPVTQDLSSALKEVAQAARALRALLDYLDRNPSALLRGKKSASIPPPGERPSNTGGKQTQ